MALTMETIFRSEQDEFLIAQQEEDDRIKTVVHPGLAKYNDTTLANDPYFVFPVKKNTSYNFQCYLKIRNGSSGPDFAWDFNPPSGTSGTYVWNYEGGANTSVYSLTANQTQSIPDSTYVDIFISGIFTTGSVDGDFHFRWAAENDSSDSCYLRASSFLTITK